MHEDDIDDNKRTRRRMWREKYKAKRQNHEMIMGKIEEPSGSGVAVILLATVAVAAIGSGCSAISAYYHQQQHLSSSSIHDEVEE